MTIGNIVVADIDPAVPEESARRSLDVSFTTEAHMKLEPMPTSVTVLGLNRMERRRLIQQQVAAKKVSWEEYQKVLTGALAVTEEEQIFQVQQQLVFKGLQVRIEAGYQDDFALIADAQTSPDGIENDPSGVPRTTFKAQDGRYPWQNSFVSEEMAPGVTYRDWALIEQLSEGFLTGETTAAEIDAKAPELLARKNFAGYLNGRVLEGDGSARVTEIAETLGLTMFFDRGQRVFLSADAVKQAEAIEMREIGEQESDKPTPGGLLTFTEPDARGFIQIRALLNHRLSPGRQVLVYDRDGAPVGAGVFRCDHVTHSGSTFDATYYSDAILRPTTIARADNN